MTVRKMSSRHPGHDDNIFIKCEPPVSAGKRKTEYSGSETMDDVPMPKSTIKDIFEGARADEISTTHGRFNPSVKHGDSQQTDPIAGHVDSIIKEARKRFSQAKLERINCCQIALLTSLTDFQANLAVSEYPRKKRESSQAGSTRDEDENKEMAGFSSDESIAEVKAQSIQPIQRHQGSKHAKSKNKHCPQHHEQIQIWLESLERKQTHFTRKIAKREAMTEEMQRGRLDVERIKVE